MNVSSSTFNSARRKAGFTIIELLIVISVIGIMTALVISAFSNAAQDTRRVIARQQQAAVQNAVNAWVTQQSALTGMTATRAIYNTAGTCKARLLLVGNYLEDSTLSHFTDITTNSNQVLSAALKKTNQYLLLDTWGTNTYPKVELK
ncbi:type II secretion system GspH family protein [Verrucomicrobiales bacterium]|nr:type II secretion system GspH family protein [Verrucomicrobiales bacterium]MDC0276222.1 type II secretion system GspH family protein [Verrucomicrobiales bacterium]MDC0312104.1 type II secretion system GspH family protein [bacterium]MDC0321790.1 type II secretion system GspH family protein [Verrucomicrobiales bacterium]